MLMLLQLLTSDGTSMSALSLALRPADMEHNNLPRVLLPHVQTLQTLHQDQRASSGQKEETQQLFVYFSLLDRL